MNFKKQNYKIKKELPTGVKTSHPEYGGNLEVIFEIVEPFDRPINGEEKQ